MKMWIARDKDNRLYLYQYKPQKDVYVFKTESYLSCWQIPFTEFPEVTFENSPMEVELVLKKQV